MAALDLTGYKLTFDDEFNNLSVSQTGAGTTWADIRSEWRFDANSDIGFGNSSFLDAASGYNPFSVQNGVLSITAEPNPTQYGYPGSWASGLITTQGNFSQEYGYFEIRANFSSLPGAWDAFWLLPDKQTPDPNNAGRWQELDVVEHYGSFPQGVYTHVHTTDAAPNVNWQQNLQVYSELAQPGGYHTYGMDWEPNTLTFYVDGQETGSIPTPSDMHSPMYMLADLAIQTSQNPANAPITSYIDYIRAYASPNTIPGVDNLVGQGGTAAAGGATDAGAGGQTGATPPVTAGGDSGTGTVTPPPPTGTGIQTGGDTGTPPNLAAGGDSGGGTVTPPPSTGTGVQTGGDTGTPPILAAGVDSGGGTVTPPPPTGTGGQTGPDTGVPPIVAAGDDAGAGTVMPPPTGTGGQTVADTGTSPVTAGGGHSGPSTVTAPPTDAGGHAGADIVTPPILAAGTDLGAGADAPALTMATLPTTVRDNALALSTDLAQAGVVFNDATRLLEGRIVEHAGRQQQSGCLSRHVHNRYPRCAQ